eukprot:CFRG1284T1
MNTRTHVYILGDSLSDSGNVHSLVQDLNHGCMFSDGRYGDGLIWHDYLEEMLNDLYYDRHTSSLRDSPNNIDNHAVGISKDGNAVNIKIGSKIDIAVHNHAYGGSTTCNDAVKGFATGLYIPVPGVSQTFATLGDPSQESGCNSVSIPLVDPAAQGVEVFFAGPGWLLSDHNIASVWTGINDVYWTLHQHADNDVDFRMIAIRTISIVESLLDMGFKTVLLATMLDPSCIPGFSSFLTDPAKKQRFQDGYVLYRTVLTQGIKAGASSRKENQKKVILWDPQDTLNREIKKRMGITQSNIGHDDVYVETIKSLYVADGFHPTTVVHKLFANDVAHAIVTSRGLEAPHVSA